VTAVTRIEIDVNPLAIKLCGNPAPRDGLEAKLSIAHSVAAALLDGAAGVAQYADARVHDPALIRLRDRVRLNADTTIGKEQARLRLISASGTTHELFVPHARGSRGQPLSEVELDTKFRGLAGGVLAPAQIDATLGVCAALESCADVGELARTAAG
jgi:2-methylcitrate dehydratase PrpD